MNEMRRVAEDDEVARVKAIAARHLTSDLVSDVDVEFGEFDDKPAMWIIFQVTRRRPADSAGQRLRGHELRQLLDAVQQDVASEIDGRYPYFRLLDPDQSKPERL